MSIGKSNAARMIELWSSQTPFKGVSRMSFRLTRQNAEKFLSLYRAGRGISNKQLNKLVPEIYNG